MKIMRSVGIAGLVVAAVAATQPAALATVKSAPIHSASFNGTVVATARSGSVIYVGGTFTRATDSTGTYARRNLAAVSAATGRLLPWKPSTNAAVLALAVSRGRVYAGGKFTRTNGVPVSRLVEMDAATGHLVRRFHPRVNRLVHAIALSPTRVYVGGHFSLINGKSRTRLAAFSRSTSQMTSWAPRADSAVRVLRRRGGQIFVGGAFHNINGVAGTNKVAVLTTTGSVYRKYTSPAQYLVSDIRLTRTRVFLAMAGPGGRVMVTGNKGGIAWRRVFDGDVNALTILDGTLYIGGHFQNRCATTRVLGASGDCRDGHVLTPRLAATSLTGSNQDWSPAADSSLGVMTLASVPGRQTLAVGGDFNSFHGTQSQPKFALFRTP